MSIKTGIAPRKRNAFAVETNVNDGRRIWQKAENCCPVCEISARAFNQAEVQRLLNLGINVNSIST